MLAIVFPGQGSQRRGMGKELFSHFPMLEKEADQILGYSIRELCTEDPANRLGQTQYTQPAIFVVNALSYLSRQQSAKVRPSYLAGHSLGEFNALWAAGAFDFSTGLKLVARRGELMSKAQGGAMAAVVGVDISVVEATLRKPENAALDLANINTPTQTVIAGPAAAITSARSSFEAAGATYIPIPVSAAFHSRYMRIAQEEFAKFLEQLELDDPTTPVISNTTALPYGRNEVRKLLAQQLASSVRWCDSIRYLHQAGVEQIEEVGHGQVLTRMLAQIPRTVTASKPTESITPRLTTKPNVPPRPSTVRGVRAEDLGSQAFRKAYGVRLAYVSGSMYRGIASEALVERMSRAGLLSFFGTAGLSPSVVEETIRSLRKKLGPNGVFGMNLLNSAREAELVECYLRHGVDVIEASAYVRLSEPLVHYRLAGLERTRVGGIRRRNRVMAKISRPETAELFMRPAPERMVQALLQAGRITAEQAQLAASVPMADDICVEADSGGHTDGGVAFVLLPTITRLRDRLRDELSLVDAPRIGAAGGIGTPEAIISALMLGADFVLTGSINQCTVEARHSDTVKDMLEVINVQDTEHAPAGDMFELGAEVQVLKRGVFFPARAIRLRELYRNFPSIEALGDDVRAQLEKSFFRRSIAEVYQEVKNYRSAEDIARAEQDPRYKMALIFKWYFAYTNELAFQGQAEHRTNYQVHCGPALGAFNQWVRGTSLEHWRARHVDDMAMRLMTGAADMLNERFARLHQQEHSDTPAHTPVHAASVHAFDETP